MSQHIDVSMQQSSIVNNLTTNDSSKALSAAQGKALNDKYTSLNSNIGAVLWSGDQAIDATDGVDIAFTRNASKSNIPVIIYGYRGTNSAGSRFIATGFVNNSTVGIAVATSNRSYVLPCVMRTDSAHFYQAFDTNSSTSVTDFHILSIYQ